MAKEFVFRVDLESDKGIKSIPRLLDLMKNYEIKGSFYVCMGGESGFLNLLRYRNTLSHSQERSIKVWTMKEKLRIALFPRDFTRRNAAILRRILAEGHELGIHGWKHREWTRGLGKISVEKVIDKAIKKYEKLFGKKPESFCAPAFNTNEKVIRILEQKSIKEIGDLEGEKPTTILGTRIINVPVTISGENKTPIIEYLVSKNKSDEEICNIIKEKIKRRNFSCFYIHGLFEARFKLNILEDIFKFVKQNKIKSIRAIDF